MRAVYDFSGEPGTAELSIIAGEILTVTRDNVGDGWCEGHNHDGQSGLFPAAYVEMVAEPPSTTTTAAQLTQNAGDYWDDDWDDDSEVGQTQPVTSIPAANHLSGQHSANLNEFTDNTQHNIPTVHSVITERSLPSQPSVTKKNNKFSTLIKSGEESFLLGTKIVPITDDDKIFIQETDDGHCSWLPMGEVYSCVVTSPKKGSKLKGLKSFIVYQLTPTVINTISYVN